MPLRPSTSAGPASGRPLSIAESSSQSLRPSGKITVSRSRPTTAHGEPALRSPMLEARRETAAERAPQSAASRLDATIDDMDKITKGIKKIKINLITQSQKEAREKARLEAEQAQAAAAAAVAKSPRTSSASTNRSVESGGLKTPNSTSDRRSIVSATSPDSTMPALTSESGLSTPNMEHYTPRTVSPEARQTVPNMSSPRSSQAAEEISEIFVPYQPGGPPPAPIASQEPLKWLPPTSPAGPAAAAPIVKKKNSTLFQYGGSGSIPFAPRLANQPTTSSQPKVQRKPSGPIRGVPRSPPKK